MLRKAKNYSDTGDRAESMKILKLPKQTGFCLFDLGSMANPICNSKQKQILIQEDMVILSREKGYGHYQIMQCSNLNNCPKWYIK